jgi:hypothetical protein
MGMVNAKSTKVLIKLLKEILGRDATIKELQEAMRGNLPKKGK